MNCAIYTAIAGEYNQLRDHPNLPGVDWIAFVTSPQLYASSNWTIQPLFSYGEADPRRQAKWYKVQSSLEMAEYDRTVWIDGSCEILRPVYLRNILNQVIEPFSLGPHMDRDCIYDEAAFSLGMRKYRDQPIREQMQYYIDEYQHPQHWGLWFTGMILRNRCPATERIERGWWNEIDRWSYQDQLSLPVVLRNLGVHPDTLYYPNDNFHFDQQPDSE